MNCPPALIPILAAAGEETGIDPCILASLAFYESSFNLDAVSAAGAWGLFQFMEATWKEWGEGDFDNAFVPEKAAKAAARYLAWLTEQLEGDVLLAILAYGWGIGNVQKWQAGTRHLSDIPKAKFNYANDVARGFFDFQASGVFRDFSKKK